MANISPTPNPPRPSAGGTRDRPALGEPRPSPSSSRTGTSPAGRPRLAELDILRAFAAVAVVLIHSTASPMTVLPVTSRSFFASSLINQWSRFSIPAFVVLTGTALFYNYGSTRTFAAGPFFRKRMQGIALPYAIWTLLYLLWSARLHINWGTFIPQYAGALLRGDAMYQLYFMVLVIQYYLLFPVLRPLARSRWFSWAVAVAVILQFVLMWDTFYRTTPVTEPWLVAVLRWRDRLFPWWLGYFALGAWIAMHVEHAQRLARRYLWAFLLAAGALLALVMVEFMLNIHRPGVTVAWAASGFRPSVYVYSLAVVMAILAFSSWMLARPGPLRDGLLELGKYSFGIYLVHPLILSVVAAAVTRLSLPPAAYLPLVFGTVLGASYLFARVVSGLPGGHWIVGRT